MYLLQISSPCLWLITVTVSQSRRFKKKSLILHRLLLFFSFPNHAFGVVSKKTSLNLESTRFSSVSTFSSVLYIQIYDQFWVNPCERLKVFSYFMLSSYSSSIYWKKNLYTPLLPLLPSKRSLDYTHENSFWNLYYKVRTLSAWLLCRVRWVEFST